MTLTEFIQVNSPNIVSETIDGEVVIVNLEKGDYYSLLNTAADIWNRIEQGTNRESIVQILERNYDCSSIDTQDAVESFLEKLQAEGLIVVNPIEPVQDRTPELFESSELIEQKQFEPLTIEKFTDMEDLLLLDPIHEADEDMGWPNAKEN